jgi:RimJ/RimL family protein N-acetyltransferase
MSYALETERLILRPPGRQDLQSIVSLIGDYAVAKNLSRAPHPYTEQDGRNFLLSAAHGWVKGDDLPFAILLRDARACIGLCGIHPSRDWEVGYWLGRPYWGNGYATEAGQRIVRHGFSLGAGKLTAKWFHDNPASGRVLEKLGFTESGEDVSTCLARGHKVNAHVVTLDRAAYGARKMAA